MSDADDELIRQPRALAISGFVLALSSVLFGILPIINFLLALAGLTLSVIALSRRNLRRLSIAGVVVAGVMVIPSGLWSAVAITSVAQSSDRVACSEFVGQMDSVAIVIKYLEASLTAMNLTGQYDKEDLFRQAEVLKLESNKLLSISGSPEFNDVRDSVQLALTDLADGIQELGASGSAAAVGTANDDYESAIKELAKICN